MVGDFNSAVDEPLFFSTVLHGTTTSYHFFRPWRGCSRASSATHQLNASTWVSIPTRNDHWFKKFGPFPTRSSTLGYSSLKQSFIRAQLSNSISDSNRDILRWLKGCWENENDQNLVFERGRRVLAGVRYIPSILSSDHSRWALTPP